MQHGERRPTGVRPEHRAFIMCAAACRRAIEEAVTGLNERGIRECAVVGNQGLKHVKDCHFSVAVHPEQRTVAKGATASVHAVETDVVFGAAVSVTSVFPANVPMQVAPQSTPAGELVMVPPPVPAELTARSKVWASVEATGPKRAAHSNIVGRIGRIIE